MKVLFAVSNENISQSIVKTYQKEYKEILSYKNVYYFNAILKEIQKDKSYDRIVISEDLQPFANNNYDTIDKFLFERLDSISDEATDMTGGDTPIILICTDRRSKSESMLIKYFGIGIYSALIGKDRSIEEVCNLINKPRTKKEAKVYYKIDSEEVNYQSENEGDVSETEIQNILTHYKRLGKDEGRYIESFNSIAAQYTDSQLKLIIKFLPLNVKAVLEANCQKYQELMTFGGERPKKQKTPYTPPTSKNVIPKQEARLEVFEQQISKSPLTKPVVIPNAVNTQNVQRLNLEDEFNDEENDNEIVENSDNKQEEFENIGPVGNLPPIQNQTRKVQSIEDFDDTEDSMLPGFDDFDEKIEPIQSQSLEGEKISTQTEEPIKKGRGRPRKYPVLSEEEKEAIPKKKRGRPKKIQQEEQTGEQFIKSIDEDEMLPGFEEQSQVQPQNQAKELQSIEDFDDEDSVLPGFDDTNEDIEEFTQPVRQQSVRQSQHEMGYNQSARHENRVSPPAPSMNYSSSSFNLSGLLSQDKKVVSFVGTTKNGTSFLVNNLGALFSSMGIKTAILDVTGNRNSYYIYTKNDENLRKVAFECMYKLKAGVAGGIQVDKNLTVYTSLPGENEDAEDFANILSTLVNNYSLVLIDGDFSTNIEYFNQAQEIYLVQNMDVLTIQPLTAFLRDLKSANVLSNEKIKIVINKEQKLRSVNSKAIVGGMAFYNDPAMSFMTELFDRNNVVVTSIPFETQNYTRYLEGLVNCEISLNGYTKPFMESLRELASIVYPLLTNRQAYKGAPQVANDYTGGNAFSGNTASTLAKMKNRF